MDRSSRQKISKETLDLKYTLDQIDLMDINTTFHPTTAEYAFLLIVHGTFSRIDHMFSHKTNVNKVKKIEIILSIFSDHNGMKLEINYKKTTGKFRNILNNMLLNNQWVKEEIKREISIVLEVLARAIRQEKEIKGI